MNSKFLRYVAYALLLFALVMAFIPDHKPTEATKVESRQKKAEETKKAVIAKHKTKMKTEEEAKEYMESNKMMNIVSLGGCVVLLVVILVRNRKNL